MKNNRSNIILTNTWSWKTQKIKKLVSRYCLLINIWLNYRLQSMKIRWTMTMKQTNMKYSFKMWMIICIVLWFLTFVLQNEFISMLATCINVRLSRLDHKISIFVLYIEFVSCVFLRFFYAWTAWLLTNYEPIWYFGNIAKTVHLQEIEVSFCDSCLFLFSIHVFIKLQNKYDF